MVCTVWKLRNFIATIFSQKFREINFLLKNFTLSWFDEKNFAWQWIFRFSTLCEKFTLISWKNISWNQFFCSLAWKVENDAFTKFLFKICQSKFLVFSHCVSITSKLWTSVVTKYLILKKSCELWVMLREALNLLFVFQHQKR